MVIRLQFFGGRGSKSGLGDSGDWLDREGEKRRGKLDPIDVRKYQGQNLERIEARIRKLSHEQLYAFDQDGKILAAYRGNATSVCFPASLLKAKGITVTHGHPKGYAEFGGTFSFADIDNMLKSEWQEHRAAASGQGEMNYIMRRTAKADPPALRERINRDYPDLIGRAKEAYKEAYDRELKLHGEKQARHVARQKQVGVLNAYYKEIFPQYGFEYITRKKEYRYNR